MDDVDKEHDDKALDIFSQDGEEGRARHVEGVPVPWVEKYRPRTLDDMILDKDSRKMLSSMVAGGRLVDMALYGKPGIGKTTLARVLANAVNAETLFVNCGTDGTVDTVRNVIRPFCESASCGRLKVVILDEFDSASGGMGVNGMQNSLRSLMEAFSDTRFIFTCNYNRSIIGAMFSRCPKVCLNPSARDVCLKLVKIWKKEGIAYDRDVAREFARRFVIPNMPDVRKVVNIAEMMCSDGTLRIADDAQSETGMDSVDRFADRLMSAIASGTDYRTVRGMISSGSSDFGGDFERLASAMAESVARNGYSPAAIAEISDAAYRMSSVADPSLQMLGLVVRLSGRLRQRV